MRLFPSLSNSEWSRLARGVFGKLVVMALIAVPSIYAGLLTYGNIDVTHHLDAVPAAIVDLDEPATTTDATGKKQTVPLGRTVTGKLVSDGSTSNLDWHLTDADDARQGLEDGTYYAVLTIPKNFSASAVSTSDADKARAARMQLQTNDATSYLAGNIAAAVANAVTAKTGDQLTQRYLDRIYLGFNDIQKQLTKIADASSQLADGTGSLATASTKLHGGATDLASGIDRLADGNAKLATGLDDASGGATRLAAGVGRLADGNAKLAAGLDAAAAQTAQLPRQTAALADGARKVAGGNAALAAGATELSTGLHRAADATGALPGQTAQLASGAKALRTGVDRLAGGGHALADGAAQVATGGQALATGAKRLADGAGQVDAGASRVASGAKDLAANQATLATGTADYTRSVDALAARCAAAGADAAFCAQLSATAGGGDRLRTGSAAAAAGSTTLATGADAVATGTGALVQGAPPLTSGADALSAGAGRLATGATAFDQGVTQLAAGAAALSTNLDTLAAAAPSLGQGIAKAAAASDRLAGATTQLATGAGAVAGGLDKLAAATPKLSSGLATAASSAGQLADGARSASTGATRLASGIGTADTAAHRLADGASSAASGAHRLADGTTQLSDAVAKLDDGANRLADGTAKGAKSVPTYDSAQRSRLANVVSAPVTTADDRLHQVPTYGYGLAPYFVALGLWVGGMSLFFMIRPFTRRALATTASTWRIALAGLATPSLFGVLQAIALTLVIRFWVGIDMASPWRFLAFAVLASLTFVAINHALNALLGPAGRFIGLLLVVVQLASAGATYPIESSPGFFQALHPLLPITYAVRAFRSLVAGGDLHLAPAAAVLLAWLAVSVCVSMFAVHRDRRWDVTRLRPAVAA